MIRYPDREFIRMQAKGVNHAVTTRGTLCGLKTPGGQYDPDPEFRVCVQCRELLDKGG